MTVTCSREPYNKIMWRKHPHPPPPLSPKKRPRPLVIYPGSSTEEQQNSFVNDVLASDHEREGGFEMRIPAQACLDFSEVLI